MHQETELIVQAIESLRQEGNFFKEYLFPMLSSFFSALLGAGVAYFALRHQENIQIEKEKLNAVNNWILIAESAFSSLIAFKANYHGKLDANPVQRALKIPTILHRSRPISEEFSGLYFIVPKKDDKDSFNIKWRGLPRIRAMISNYNTILDLWEKRNEIERPIKEKILQDNATLGFVDISREQVFQSVGATYFIALIDLTERAIRLTDDLIIELNDFLTEFPNIGRSLINTKKLKRYGSILTISINENPKLLDMLVKTSEVDFESLSELYGRSAEQVRKEYRTGYE